MSHKLQLIVLLVLPANLGNLSNILKIYYFQERMVGLSPSLPSTEELRCEKCSWALFIFPKATSSWIAYHSHSCAVLLGYKHAAGSLPPSLGLLVSQVVPATQMSHATQNQSFVAYRFLRRALRCLLLPVPSITGLSPAMLLGEKWFHFGYKDGIRQWMWTPPAPTSAL